jgi:nucleotide-binding universal stress UspA family protein
MRYGRSSTSWVPNLGDMAKLRDRREDITAAPAAPTRARPVLLATLSVRVDPSAERMAIDSALEASVPLLIVNLIRLPPYATTLILAGPEHTTLPHEEDLEAVRATANRAADLGLKTELLRVRTKRPVQALLEVAGERDAGLIVFGPHLGRVGRIRFRRAAQRIRREASCLVWIAPDG